MHGMDEQDTKRQISLVTDDAKFTLAGECKGTEQTKMRRKWNHFKVGFLGPAARAAHKMEDPALRHALRSVVVHAFVSSQRSCSSHSVPLVIRVTSQLA